MGVSDLRNALLHGILIASVTALPQLGNKNNGHTSIQGRARECTHVHMMQQLKLTIVYITVYTIFAYLGCILDSRPPRPQQGRLDHREVPRGNPASSSVGKSSEKGIYTRALTMGSFFCTN